MEADDDLPSLGGSITDEDDVDAPSFHAAAAAIEAAASAGTLPRAATLKLYALFKQAAAGDAPARGPSALLDPRDRAKWSAWDGVRGMSREAARRAYAAEAARVGLEVGVARPGQAPPAFFGPVLSALAGVLGGGDAPQLPPLSAAAADGDADGVRAALEAGASPAEADADGATPLHFAADAGCAECVRLLLDAGADVGAVDAEGEAAAAYGRAAGRDAVAELLEEEEERRRRGGD